MNSSPEKATWLSTAHRIHPRFRQGDQSGMTLVEMLMAIAIGSIILIVLVSIVGRSFNTNRRLNEQVRITEDARLQLERMSETIRNADQLDCNSDGSFSGANEGWLRSASDNDVQVYSDLDENGTSDLVRYFIEPNSSQLKRGVRQHIGPGVCDFTPTENIQVIAQSIRNTTTDPAAVFKYFTGGADSELPQPAPVVVANLPSIGRVGLKLNVDVSDRQSPGAAEIATDVVPRTAIEPKVLQPAVAIAAVPDRVRYLGQTTVNWTANNVTSCLASDSWNGNKATSGSETRYGITQALAFRITCTGPYGSVVGVAQVIVYDVPIPVTPTPPRPPSPTPPRPPSPTPSPIASPSPVVQPTPTPSPSPSPSPTPILAPLECTPASQGVLVNAPVVVQSTKSGVPVSVNWSASGGNPSSGIGGSFQTKYSSAGTRSIVLSGPPGSTVVNPVCQVMVFNPGGPGITPTPIIPTPTPTPNTLPPQILEFSWNNTSNPRVCRFHQISGVFAWSINFRVINASFCTYSGWPGGNPITINGPSFYTVTCFNAGKSTSAAISSQTSPTAGAGICS